MSALPRHPARLSSNGSSERVLPGVPAGALCLCEHLRAHAHDAVIARLVDALRDELCVRELQATGLGERPPEEIAARHPGYRRALEALGFGSLRVGELVDEVYPHRTDDPRERELRRRRVNVWLGRLVERGEVRRVGWGWYQLRRWGPRERRRSTFEDCRRLLMRQRGEGATARELADALDAPLNTVQTWLKRLRRLGRGMPLLVTIGPRGTAGGYRYRLQRDQEIAS